MTGWVGGKVRGGYVGGWEERLAISYAGGRVGRGPTGGRVGEWWGSTWVGALVVGVSRQTAGYSMGTWVIGCRWVGQSVGLAGRPVRPPSFVEQM